MALPLFVYLLMIPYLIDARFFETDIYYKQFRDPFYALAFGTWDVENNMEIVLSRIITNRPKGILVTCLHYISDLLFLQYFRRMSCALFMFLRRQGIEIKFIFDKRNTSGKGVHHCLLFPDP